MGGRKLHAFTDLPELAENTPYEGPFCVSGISFGAHLWECVVDFGGVNSEDTGQPRLKTRPTLEPRDPRAHPESWRGNMKEQQTMGSSGRVPLYLTLM